MDRRGNRRRVGHCVAVIPRGLVAFVGLLALLILVAGPGLAQDSDDGDAPSEPASEDEEPVPEEPASVPPTVVIFVIDLSGSMNEPFDGDRTKLEVAKEAFSEAFTNVSPSAFVGLRVYGDQLDAQAAAQREQNCTEDTRLVVPITQIDREGLIEEVQSFDARGDTAIGLALRAANDDIPDGALGTVVLFSDGRDECFDADLDGDPANGPSFGEDPCEVAKDIAGDGVDLRIDRVETVGFGADEAAELELRCIADSTGGSYTPIETPADARDLLPELLADISSPREAERLGGEPIEGTPDENGAPELPRLDGSGSTDGRYTDSIEMNSERWYQVTEFGPGGGTFTATAFGLPAQEGISFGIRVYLPEADRTFFDGRVNDNAGLPRRPTVSVRCPGCSISGGPNEIYWIVSLSSENSELGGVYDIELLTEGPAFGGLSTSCEEPQECWFSQEVASRTVALEEAQAEYEQLVADAVPPETAERRNQLLQERDQSASDLLAAEAEAKAAEDAASETQARAATLQQAADELGGESTSLGLPLVLGLGGVAAGAAGLLMRRNSATPKMASDESEGGDDQ